MRHVRIEKDDGGNAVLWLDNADNPVNLITDEWVGEMQAAIAALRGEGTVKGIVIASAKQTFLAGADLKGMISRFPERTVPEAYEMSQRGNSVNRALETMGKPVACAINGACLGGGYELALACHYRVMADDQPAVVGLPEVTLGLMPGAGGTQRLPRMIELSQAFDVILTGRAFRAADAAKLGLVDETAPAAKLMDNAKAWLASNPDPAKPWDRDGYSHPAAGGMIRPDIAAQFTVATAAVVKKAGYNYPAPAAILSAVFEGLQLPFDRGIDIEAKYFATLLTGEVARNIIRTGFVSKQAAENGSRQPDNVEPSPVSKVGVLGAGMMGAGIALVSAQAGLDVVLLDLDLDKAKFGRAYSERTLGKLVAKGRMTEEKRDVILARIDPVDDYAALQGCELVIEAVFENAAIKAETIRKAQAVVDEAGVMASNTSTLPISRLAEASVRPDRFIGLHFFSPVERMQLVEIIKGEQTSDQTLADSLAFVAKIGKTPIVVNDSRGFYTSRVFQTLIHEGAAMLADGVNPARIENAAKSAGFPVGPLALLDEVTLSLPLMVVDQAIEQEGENYVPPIGVPLLRMMLALGRTGKKDGAGFYNYDETGKSLWKGLGEHFAAAQIQPDIEELKQRFLYAQAMETARCFEENVIETPQDADLGAVFGWGFPTWTGGTLSYIDMIGIDRFVSEADRLAQQYGARFAPTPAMRKRAANGEAYYN